MKKIFVLSLVFLLTLLCHGKNTTAVNQIEGAVLHTMQSFWEIAETENSGDTQTDALGSAEMTKKIVDALIAANNSNETYISVYPLPSKWNGVRFRAIGISAGGSLTHQIYLGSLGGKLDCELSHAGQLAWTIGDQDSIYAQIAFTLGGPYEPQIGDLVTSETNGKTAIVVSKTLTSGAWADSDAAGVITYKSANGAFDSTAETIKITDYLGVTQTGVLTHVSTVLVDFELADTLTVTAKSWNSTWSSISPADNTNAEAEIDIKGADIMIIVTTICSVDGKLLIKGY